MAQAHQSVSYSSIHYYRDDKKVFQHEWNSRLRWWRKQITKFRSKIRNSAYPAHVESLWMLIVLVTGLHFADRNSPYGLMKYLTGFRVIAE